MGYDQKIKIKASFEVEAKGFFNFLQKVGRRYSRPVKINYRYLGRGFFYVTVDGGSGGIDALFQELVLSRGLYYYGCALPNRREVITFVIVPIFKQLIDYRFDNPQSRFLRKHILGKFSQKDFIPSEIKNNYGYDFEILFRRWDIGMISNKDYVIGLDALLTNFLLDKLGHRAGEKSGRFSNLIQPFKKICFLNLEAENNFKRVHKLRVGALHRLELLKNTQELYDISNSLFSFFGYLDEVGESQFVKYICGRKKRAKRYKYGTAVWIIGREKFYESNKADKPCSDCGVPRGFLHVVGCDWEKCPICGEALGGLLCKHRYQTGSY